MLFRLPKCGSRQSRAYLGAVAAVVGSANVLHAAELLVVSESARAADFQAVDETGALTFVDDAGKETSVPISRLVRWGSPRGPRASAELHLVDGSRLSLAAAWSDSNVLTVEQKRATAETQLLGSVGMPRAVIRGALWDLPPDPRQRLAKSDRLFAGDTDGLDRVELKNGDSLQGRLVAMRPIAEGSAAIEFESSIGSVQIEESSLAGFALARKADESSEGAGRPTLMIGMRDGSRLVADKISTRDQQFDVRLKCGVEVLSGYLRDIVFLQTLGGRAIYLSDLKPISYRHIPYLEIPWPYARDRNVLQGPLIVDGRLYEKGLGMHSASRLTYDVSKFTGRRLVARTAIDDAALRSEQRPGGSAAFRVYLRNGGPWRLAYQGQPLRAGNPPEPIVVELADANQAALLVDYGDRGDERDYANWLDARLE